jgi:glycylpeptide N-tetradecanoyltransferase
MSADEVRELLSEMEVARRGNKPRQAETGERHAFWDTQPVPGLEEDTDGIEPGDGEPIHPADPSKVRAEPYGLPSSFEWTDLDLNDEAQTAELYTLLHENYVEDGDHMFRFDYSIPFIRWAMQPPGHRSEWHVGVRVSQTRKLVAFIGCTPAELLCHGKRIQPGPLAEAGAANGDGGDAPAGEASSGGAGPESGEREGAEEGQSVVEVNFLCVHKKLRSKRLAPVRMKGIPWGAKRRKRRVQWERGTRRAIVGGGWLC